MDGLIILIILVPLVFFVLLLSIYNRTGEQQRLLESLYDKIKELNKEMSSLSRELKNKTPVKETEKEELKITPPRPVIADEVTAEEKSITKPAPSLQDRPQKKEVTVEAPAAPAKQEKIPGLPGPTEKKNWLPENPDWEKFIGENLANKIGIAVLVLGIAFFVKYAIDKNWINEAGRVIIGLLCGAILTGLAHYFRNSYRSFSSVLVGGGLSVFYFSVAFAFHQYELIGQTPAFIFMVIISGFGVVLSVFYDRQELAILASIGGFITPFLVSTGQDNYVALFTYLCILNAGIMVLSWFKRWSAINVIALFFTTFIYGGWLLKRVFIDDDKVFPYKEAFLFATLFYLLFMVMHIVNTLRLRKQFNAFDFVIVLSTNFLYYISGMFILSQWNDGDYKGLFTLLAGLFNLALTAVFYHTRSVDRNFVSLLTGLSLTYISLAAAVQLKGNHVALFWAAEMAVLYWLYLRSKIVLLKKASFILAALTMASLLITWNNVYLSSSDTIPVILNKGFVTSLAVSVIFILHYRLQKKDTLAAAENPAGIAATKRIFLVAGISVFYMAGLLEIFCQFSTHMPGMALYMPYLQLFSFAFIILLLLMFRKDKLYPVLKLFFTIYAFGVYIMGVGVTNELSLSLINSAYGSYFTGHWLAVILLLFLLYDITRISFLQAFIQWKDYRNSFTWLTSAAIVILLSIEMYHLLFWSFYNNEAGWAGWKNLYYKPFLTVLWGICSFVMMWVGMKKDYRPLRIISLTLFSITLAKLFIYDIRNIPPGGKIVAFILLGILLLAVSFMYQRLKKIIIDNNVG